MMQPNFKTMDIAQLRTYVLKNRDDQAAFNAFIDRLNTRPATKSYPCSNTPENIEIAKKAIRENLGK